jgi:hypothetical protein
MQLNDLSKDLQRFLLRHWTEKEVNSHLTDPEYFFEQVVNPHLAYLRRNGEDAPTIRFQRTASGEPRALMRA